MGFTFRMPSRTGATMAVRPPERETMNFQQLRYVREAVRNDLNLTEASHVLNTSQSGVSKQIRELEIELGIEIFVRRGKRLVGLTSAGEGAVKLIERVLQETENLKRHAGQFADETSGQLTIATTHNQARYVLPKVIDAFASEYPGVRLELIQVTPGQAAHSVASGESDLAVATEALDLSPNLATFPCFSWRHVAIAPADHPLANADADLTSIANWPLITYNSGFTGRSQIDAAFAAKQIEPDVRLAAMDSDIIKIYVARGLGIGVISEMALAEPLGPQLVELKRSRELFEPSTTKVAVLRGALLRAYAYRFIELLAPHLGTAIVRKTSLERISSTSGSGRLGAAAEIPTFGEYFARTTTSISRARGRV
jgi:DNA-binding transcriptional LysR family regulator